MTTEIEAKPVEEIGISNRIRLCLYRAGIMTIGDLMKADPYDLLRARNLGPKGRKEIREKATIYGLKLDNIP